MKDVKSTKQTKPVGTAKSKNELTGREPPVVHPQGAERPRRGRPVRIDDDWTQRDRKRGRRNDTLWIPEAKERTQPKNPDAVAKSKYQPTDYERTALAKQAERLKDQVRVPRMKFVEDYGGGGSNSTIPIRSSLLRFSGRRSGRQTISLLEVCYITCARHCRSMRTRHLTILVPAI
jgi:hypothetical protein